MSFENRLIRLSEGAASIIPEIKRGIEKESLRINPDGRLSEIPHPKELGSTLTHPYITTDYSEALLELVTPVFTSTSDMLQHLTELHKIVYHHIGNEMLWVNSLPCLLSDESSIPIAQFGTSNIGQMKHVYRRGLGVRYGRKMQVIAGLHYNFSVPDTFWEVLGIKATETEPDAVSNAYMAGTRNFHHHCWLLFYLFGASPAACRSFFSDMRPDSLSSSNSHTLYGQYATSLRMSNFGYRNPVQSEIRIDHNSVDGYIHTLSSVINKPYRPYQEIGVKRNGTYLQLNANLLQIENEYYSVIRPKRTIRPQEKPTAALRDRGVEYLEVRCLDLDPFNPIGISENQARFMDLFLTFCLLNPVEPMSKSQQEVIAANKDAVVLNGRAPDLKLQRDGKTISPRAWGNDLLDRMEGIATVFDKSLSANYFTEALSEQRAKIEDASLTPSAKIIAALKANEEPFFDYALRLAENAKQSILATSLEQDVIDRYYAVATESFDRQRKIEESDDTDFDTFLERYFNR